MIRRAIEWYIEIWDRIATRLILIEQRLRDKLAEPAPPEDD